MLSGVIENKEIMGANGELIKNILFYSITIIAYFV